VPCDCELDLTRRLVNAFAWGTITYDEAVATRLKFTTHPSFKPDFDQIYDIRGVTRLNITAAQLQTLAASHLFGRGSRRAFVAPRSVTFSFARTFQLYRQFHRGEEQIKLFHSLEDAEAWIAGRPQTSLIAASNQRV
jgi:hypothetical protein